MSVQLGSTIEVSCRCILGPYVCCCQIADGVDWPGRARGDFLHSVVVADEGFSIDVPLGDGDSVVRREGRGGASAD